MIIGGVDPGKTGGVVYLNEAGEILEAYGADREDGYILKGDHLFIEHSQSMPGQSCVAMFNYGVTFGRILGAVDILKIKHTLVKPRSWQKIMYQGVSPTLEGKKRSLEAVRRLNADALKLFTYPRCKNAHLGLVDAYLIASWGLHYLRSV